MKINKETTKIYLENHSKAILDAKNLVFTESDLQSAINKVYKEIKPKGKGKGFPSFLHKPYYEYPTQLVTSQYYLDEVMKPFVRKINEELNWNISICDDIMK